MDKNTMTQDHLDPNKPKSLAGVTVIDFTRVLSGPTCTMMLADQGARVIKIERPQTGDDTRQNDTPAKEWLLYSRKST